MGNNKSVYNCEEMKSSKSNDDKTEEIAESITFTIIRFIQFLLDSLLFQLIWNNVITGFSNIPIVSYFECCCLIASIEIIGRHFYIEKFDFSKKD